MANEKTGDKWDSILKYGLPIGGQLIQGIAQMLLGGRSGFSKASEKMIPGLEQGLNRGITTGDLAGVAPLAIKAALPMINRTAATYSSRFGRSGYARGAAIGQVANVAGQSAEELARMRLANNQQNLRQIYDRRFQAALG